MSQQETMSVVRRDSRRRKRTLIELDTSRIKTRQLLTKREQVEHLDETATLLEPRETDTVRERT